MCTGRVDLAHIFRVFSNGLDGVFIGGCRLKECNYIMQGNYHALNRVLLSKKIMAHIGLNPERLRIEFMSSGEGNLFVEVVNDFIEKVRELGPLGRGEGIEEEKLKFKLKAVTRLIPYMRLVESERLRLNFETIAEYEEFYASEEFARLFQELITDKLELSQILLLLEEKPFSNAEIASILELTPSEVSRHINSSAKYGFIRYEENEKRFSLA